MLVVPARAVHEEPVEVAHLAVSGVAVLRRPAVKGLDQLLFEVREVVDLSAHLVDVR